MAAHWPELNLVWRQAFEQAITAYLERDSVPIGAVVVDRAGDIVARGGNSFSAGRLAHAEFNALVALGDHADRKNCEIYSTVEPCPMCTGAIRMSQLRAVHFAARDPGAGSTGLFNANEFMREFPCAVHPPNHSDLESVVVSLVVEYRLRTGHARWLEHWRTYHPIGVSLGLRLFQSMAYSNWLTSSATAENIYEQITSMRSAT